MPVGNLCFEEYSNADSAPGLLVIIQSFGTLTYPISSRPIRWVSVYETDFSSEEVSAVVVTSVVAAVVLFVFFSPFPHADSINADRSVIEPNKILFFTMLNLLKWLTYKYFIIF